MSKTIRLTNEDLKRIEKFKNHWMNNSSEKRRLHQRNFDTRAWVGIMLSVALHQEAGDYD